MKKSVRLTISGSLQPVFFNAFIRENAEKLGVKGFMRKLEDGRVEIFIEGDTDQVDQMVPICERGPSHSMVRKMEIKEERFQDFKDFKVLNF